MKALAGDYVFTHENSGKKVAEDVTSDKEGIDLGIGFEKDSIVFYTKMERVVPEYDRKILEDLITQEQDHLKKLLSLKKTL